MSDDLFSRRWRLWLALLALFACLPYLRTLQDSFVGDDYWFVRNAADSHGFLDATRLPRRWSEFWWRPLGVASWWLMAPFTGLEPLPHRAASLALHVGSVLAVASLVRRLAGRAHAGLIAGLLFAWHPTCAEAVVWCSSRFDAGAAMGTLIGLAAFAAEVQRPSRGAKLALAAAYLFALGCKESAVLLPPLAVAMLLAWRPRDWRRVLPACLLLAAMTLLYLGLRWLELGGLGGFPRDPGTDPPNKFRPEAVVGNLRRIARALLLPGDWLHPGVRTSELALVAAAAATWVFSLGRGARQALHAGAVPTLLAVLFVCPLVGWYAPGWHDEHARYLYLPLAFTACAIGALCRGPEAGLGSLANWRRALGATLLAVTLGLWLRDLHAHTLRWTRASVLADRIADEFPKPDPAARHVMVTGLPEMLDGAFVFVNGFRMLQRNRGYPVPIHLLEEQEWNELRARADRVGHERRNIWRWDVESSRWSERPAEEPEPTEPEPIEGSGPLER